MIAGEVTSQVIRGSGVWRCQLYRQKHESKEAKNDLTEVFAYIDRGSHTNISVLLSNNLLGQFRFRCAHATLQRDFIAVSLV